MLDHDALLYRGLDDFVAGTAEFVGAALAAGEPVTVSVPTGHIEPLRSALNGAADRVRFLDMTEVGRNPARIIPMLREWFDEHPGRRLRFVGEPIWPGRRECECVEGMRHEALLNVAFADTPVWILCPYDITGLDPRVVAEAEHTHPTIVDAGGRRASHGYREPADVYAARERPLPEPPEGSQEFAVTADLAALRRFVRTHAAAAGLDEERTANVLVAANEAASNTLLHGGRDGVARIWHDGDHMICEIADSGRIDDLLAGRRVPDDRQTSGRGLWLVNRLCDFAEVRSGPEATVLRLHMRLG